MISHSPYSTVLSPLVTVWAWMKAEISQTTYQNVEDPIEVIHEKWNSMTLQYQNDLIDYQIKVVKAIFEAKANYIQSKHL